MKKVRSVSIALRAASIHERKMIELGLPQRVATASAVSLYDELIKRLP